jgi:hypothetical protein
MFASRSLDEADGLPVDDSELPIHDSGERPAINVTPGITTGEEERGRSTPVMFRESIR